MDIVNFPAMIRQYGFLAAAEVDTQNDLLVIGQKYSNKRDGTQYVEHAMKVSEFLTLAGGGGDSMWKASTGTESMVPDNTAANVAEGDRSIATGYYSRAYGSDSTAQGYRTYALTSHSTTNGKYTIAGVGVKASTDGISTITVLDMDVTSDFQTGDVIIVISGSQSYGDFLGELVISDSYLNGPDTVIEVATPLLDTATEVNIGNLTRSPLEPDEINQSAEGVATLATGRYSKAYGGQTWARGSRSHAEGDRTIAYNSESHAEGDSTLSFSSHSHSEGVLTAAHAGASHAEGASTTSYGSQSHVEGFGTSTGLMLMGGVYTDIDRTITFVGQDYTGNINTIFPIYLFDTLLYRSYAPYPFIYAESVTLSGGGDTLVVLRNALGIDTTVNVLVSGGGDSAHAEGYSTHAGGEAAHAEGKWTIATGSGSHSGGSGDGTYFVIASGIASFNHSGAIGDPSEVSGDYSAILGGIYNNCSHDRSVVLGGAGQGSLAADTVYVPNFEVTVQGGSIIMKDVNGIRWAITMNIAGTLDINPA